VSEGGDVGRSAIWRRELEEAYYQNSINRVRGLEGNNNYYLNYLLSCIKESGAIDVICNRLSIAHLTTEKLNEIQILFPTAEEQSAIAAFLDEKTTQVDQLIEKTQQSIDLLKEKRAALITAAVTGKIDVRNERI
ncbi:restriction endonuclease subunit S, partial [Thiolapillus sp.]